MISMINGLYNDALYHALNDRMGVVSEAIPIYNDPVDVFSYMTDSRYSGDRLETGMMDLFLRDKENRGFELILVCRDPENEFCFDRNVINPYEQERMKAHNDRIRRLKNIKRSDDYSFREYMSKYGDQFGPGDWWKDEVLIGDLPKENTYVLECLALWGRRIIIMIQIQDGKSVQIAFNLGVAIDSKESKYDNV